MNLAYECSCHTTPPCRNCEQWCEACEGSGKVRMLRNYRGELDYDTGVLTEEYDVCQNCNGEGTLI